MCNGTSDDSKYKNRYIFLVKEIVNFTQNLGEGFSLVYKIPYRRAWASSRVRRASKGILHTSFSPTKSLAQIFQILRRGPEGKKATSLLILEAGSESPPQCIVQGKIN